MKIAMPVQTEGHRECLMCHCFTHKGYILRDSIMSRFVCEDCYLGEKERYPLALKCIEIKKKDLDTLIPNENAMVFSAGYLLGKKRLSRGGWHIQVTGILKSADSTGSAARLFCPQDVMRIRKVTGDGQTFLVGIFRTNPKGSCAFNNLDQTVVKDLLMDIVYVIFAGKNEIQIAARDKVSDETEIGVTVL